MSDYSGEFIHERDYIKSEETLSEAPRPHSTRGFQRLGVDLTVAFGGILGVRDVAQLPQGTHNVDPLRLLGDTLMIAFGLRAAFHLLDRVKTVRGQ